MALPGDQTSCHANIITDNQAVFNKPNLIKPTTTQS